MTGYVVGALTVGYFRREIEGARPTKTGGPRAVPTIEEEAAPHTHTAFEDVRAGMPIRRAWRKYVAVGGKGEPRAQGQRMSCTVSPDACQSPLYRVLGLRAHEERLVE